MFIYDYNTIICMLLCCILDFYCHIVWPGPRKVMRQSAFLQLIAGCSSRISSSGIFLVAQLRCYLVVRSISVCAMLIQTHGACDKVCPQRNNERKRNMEIGGTELGSVRLKAFPSDYYTTLTHKESNKTTLAGWLSGEMFALTWL